MLHPPNKHVGSSHTIIFVISLLSANVALAGEVTIHRDNWGVPHIYADVEEDGFFGLGYALAEDRLERFLGSILWATGTQASVRGKSAIQSDIDKHLWMHPEEARQGFSRLGPQLRTNYEAFVDGVKRYMDLEPDRVPEWAPEFDATTMVTLTRAVLFEGMILPDALGEVRRGGAPLSTAEERIVAQEAGASNGWVLAPWRTAADATVVLADPHVSINDSSYYEYRMTAGSLKSSGYALGPLLWQAHNRHVAWAFTTGAPDVADCYAVVIDPKNPSRYQYDGQWREMITREVSINAKGSETVRVVLEYIRINDLWSPVVGRDKTTAYAVCTAYMHDAGTLDEEIYRMNLARNVSDVRNAMEKLGMFPQNVLVGDSEGGMYYVRAGKTAKRPVAFDWTRPVPGNSSNSAWRGIHALEDLVQIDNPVQGYLQNNNVSPDTMVHDASRTAEHYPAEVFNDTPGRITTRGLRSDNVLSKAVDFTLEDAFAHAFDEKWINTAFWQESLRLVLRDNREDVRNRTPEFRQFLGRLISFDGFARAGSVDALNFYYWRDGLLEAVTKSGVDAAGMRKWTPSEMAAEAGTVLFDKAQLAIDRMKKELGSTDVAMGKVFQIGREEKFWPLGGESINAPGLPSSGLADLSPFAERTMRAFASRPPDSEGRRLAVRGSQAMRLVQFTNPIQSFTLHPYGQNDDPTSPHYTDQAAMTSKQKMKPAYFNRDQLEGHIVSTKILRRESQNR